MFEGLEDSQLEGAIEAMLFVTDEPATVVDLAQMLDVDVDRVSDALNNLKSSLNAMNSGIELREIAGGWRLYTREEFHNLIERYVLSWDTRRMSQAALEVLAVVAYGQPMTRLQISTIRGVSSDSALNTLIERGYVREVGTSDAAGNPVLYGTTKSFLEKFGFASTDELPDLEQYAPDIETVNLIRERLGAARIEDDNASSTENAEGANVIGDMFGVVEKIDFDKLTFNTDDE